MRGRARRGRGEGWGQGWLLRRQQRRRRMPGGERAAAARRCNPWMQLRPCETKVACHRRAARREPGPGTPLAPPHWVAPLTWSPGLTDVTPSPTLSTMPAASWPRMQGNRPGEGYAEAGEGVWGCGAGARGRGNTF
jgi:hypothetical protein